ncbi:hypothetical protein ACLB1R_08725 [Escherichia coli]
MARPGNVWARLGTPVRHLLNDAGFCPSADQMVTIGGPTNGLYLAMAGCPGGKRLPTVCWLPLPMSLANHRKNKAASGVALLLDTCPAGSFAATVVLVQQRSATR